MVSTKTTESMRATHLDTPMVVDLANHSDSLRERQTVLPKATSKG